MTANQTFNKEWYFLQAKLQISAMIFMSMSASMRPVLMDQLLYVAWSGEGGKVLHTDSGSYKRCWEHKVWTRRSKNLD